MHELKCIENELESLGANRDYCLAYFQSGGGVCERTVAGVCVRHRACQAPLPPGRMCSLAFGRAAAILVQEIARVESERLALRDEWQTLKQEQTALQFLNDAQTRQEEIEERKNVLKSRMNHRYMELRNLMGERLRLLECFTPIDAVRFHQRVSELLMRRIALLERCKLGGPAG